MKRILFIPYLCILIMLLSGCSTPLSSLKSDNVDKDTTEVTSNNLSSVEVSTASKIEIETRTNPSIIFDSLGKMPLVLNGNIVGNVRINQIEKVHIADFTNEAATAAGVQYSYAINMRVNLSDYKEQMLSLICNPVLVDENGNQIGKLGDIGWSGFSTQVSYVNDFSQDKTLEVILQPETLTIPETAVIKLSFSSLNNQIVFDDILLSASLLNDVKEGPSIKTVNDITEIESINGARYSINFHDAHYQWNEKTTDTSDTKFSFFNFVYDLKYLSAPTSALHVGTFDSFDSNALNTPLVVGMQMDSNSNILYDNDETATRLMYKDDTRYYPYVSTWDKPLYVGDSVSMTCNREYKDSRDQYNPTYIRLRVEFPEEASARNDEELLQFNGRYCVYQLKIEPTEMIEREDN